MKMCCMLKLCIILMNKLISNFLKINSGLKGLINKLLINMERFAGLNFRGFHGFQEYCNRVFDKPLWRTTGPRRTLRK